MKKNFMVIVITFILTYALTGCSKGTGIFEADNKLDTNTSSDISSEVTSSDVVGIDDSVVAKVASTEEVITALSAFPDRIPGSENNEKAVKWIAGQFELLDLEPLLKEDYFWSYQQNINGQTYYPNNVVGYIPGSDSTQAIIISCHLDAVTGSSGAVDNASGVAAMLRTISNILEDGNKLNADIIFCAFNGEEQNYAGSKAFVAEFQGKYETVCNINYDCVGVINGGYYMFGVEEIQVGYEMNREMRSYLDKYKIDYGEYLVSGVRSDHISFENAKIPNINFTQIGIRSVTHSFADQKDKLDMEQINLLADCVSDYLCE